MDSFIYSINATVPIFCIMLIGWILRRNSILTDEFSEVANKFVFKIALPCKLLLDLAKTDMKNGFDIKYVVFCFLVTLFSIVVIWILSRKILKNKEEVGAFVQASYRSSAAILGVAFIENIYGNSGMAPLMMIGAVPLYNVFAVIILTFENPYSKFNGKKRILKSIKGVITNPIIDAIFLGMFFSLINFNIPPILDKTVNYLGITASPLALLAIGAGFQGKKAIKKIKPTIAASCIKLVILELIFLPIAIIIGFENQKLLALLIMLGSPTTPTAYIMCKNMGGDEVLSSSVIVFTTLLSAITLTFWIFIVRYLGFIA